MQAKSQAQLEEQAINIRNDMIESNAQELSHSQAKLRMTEEHLNQKSQLQIGELKSTHESEINTLRKSIEVRHGEEIALLETKSQTRLEEMQNKMELKISHLIQEHDEQYKELKQKRKDETDGLKNHFMWNWNNQLHKVLLIHVIV